MSDRLDHRIDDFIWNCRRILENKGSTEARHEIGVAAVGYGINPNGALGFGDEVVRIVCEAKPSLAMVVTKVSGGNPVMCLDARGDIYRQHMDFQKIAPHVEKLCRLSLVERLSRMSPEVGGYGIVNMDHIFALGEVVDAAADLGHAVASEKRLFRALADLRRKPLVE